MNKLRRQQSLLQEYLLGDSNENLDNYFAAPEEGDIINRLRVYREGYYLRLIDVLQSDFKTLYKVLGEEAFIALSREYIDAYHSSYFSLDDYAKDFPLFIKQKQLPLHYEIAHFEWAIAKTRLIKPEPFITELGLSTINPNEWEGLCFRIQKSALLYCYEHPVLHFFESRTEAPADSPIDMLIWQKEHLPFYLVLSPAQKAVFSSLKEGKKFSILCHEMCKFMSCDLIPGFVSDTLRQFIKDELITDFYFS